MAATSASESVMALQALAFGLADGGVRVMTGYPGFHAHDLIDLAGGRPSVNEHTAFSVAWGAAVAGARAAVAVKNVGLNVAADTFVNSMSLGLNAGMVAVVFDDVELAGSQCRQDSRHYFDLAPGLWFEPCSSEHAYWCAREAPRLSEQFDVPVVIRVTNPLLRLHGQIRREADEVPLRPFLRDPGRFVAHPVNARERALAVARRQRDIAEYIESLYQDGTACSTVRVGPRELVGARGHDESACHLWTYPLPERHLRHVLASAQEFEVTELGSPFVQEKVRALLSRVTVRADDPAAKVDHSAGYRITADFDTLFAALRSFLGRLISGDLGSYTMDPARTIDACLCYGASVPVAVGAALAKPRGPAFAITGDAAFLHSGQAALQEGRERGAQVVVVVLDNGGAKSTGGQVLPGCLSFPAGLSVYQARHATMTEQAYRVVLARLAALPGIKILRVCC